MNTTMPEPWLTNIAWGKFAAFLGFVGLILNQLRTAPVPASWQPWLAFAGALIAAITGFILNPKTKKWERDGVMVADTAPEVEPRPIKDPMERKAREMLESKTPEEIQALLPDLVPNVAAEIRRTAKKMGIQL
jgi:hypothetical protein